MATLEARLQAIERGRDGRVEILRTGRDGERITVNGETMPPGYTLPKGCIHIVRSYGAQHDNA